MLPESFAHYRVLNKLGEGGIGVVYKILDTHLDRPVALKVLPLDRTADAERKRRFVQEAKAASALNLTTVRTSSPWSSSTAGRSMS
jgi:eukaryotic-like serine/threonine-protein kinase